MEDSGWKQKLNKDIVDDKEGETLPSANVSSSAGDSEGADVSSSAEASGGRAGGSGGADVSRSAGASGGADVSGSAGASGGAEVSRNAGASGGRNTTPGTPRPDQFQDDRRNLQGPVISQPGRALPDIPTQEEVTPRRGRGVKPREDDLLQEDLSDHR